jgi:hypothetical protein
MTPDDICLSCEGKDPRCNWCDGEGVAPRRRVCLYGHSQFGWADAPCYTCMDRHVEALDLMAKIAIQRQRTWVDGRNTSWVVP